MEPDIKDDADVAKCTFCGKPRTQLEHLIMAPDRKTYICNECVLLSAEILAEQKETSLIIRKLEIAASFESVSGALTLSANEARNILRILHERGAIEITFTPKSAAEKVPDTEPLDKRTLTVLQYALGHPQSFYQRCDTIIRLLTPENVNRVMAFLPPWVRIEFIAFARKEYVSENRYEVNGPVVPKSCIKAFREWLKTEDAK